MRKYVINLDRCPERLALFNERNNHVKDIERFPAIDGRQLNRDMLIEEGFITRGSICTLNSAGSAMSHMTLWERAVRQNEPICIIEDDAILSLFFEDNLKKLIDSNVPWDYVAWGWNFDAPLYTHFIPGVTHGQISVSQDQLRKNIERFRSMRLNVQLSRLINYYGIMCYSVSPRGADRLLKTCKPLRADTSTVDGLMNSVYSHIQAYVAIPPVAVAENDHRTSTIINA